jgi:integrase
MTTFAEQAKTFLTEGANRAKRPFRPNTLKTYKSQIETVINPLIGSNNLQDVNNALLKSVCLELGEQEYSAKSIGDILTVIKQIVKSAVDSEGNFLYPRVWNTKFIDAPSVEDQKQPTIDASSLSEALSKAAWSEKPLFVILAATGLRIAEALALHVGPDNGITSYWIPQESKIIVRQQRDGGNFGPTKTKAGVREVDLAPELNEFLKQTIRASAQSTYLLFPQSEAFYRESLVKIGILGGFHTLRRFRVSYLKSVSVPDMLIKFWSGHAAGDITERYTKVGSEIQIRKEAAAKAGLGFELK